MMNAISAPRAEKIDERASTARNIVRLGVPLSVHLDDGDGDPQLEGNEAGKEDDGPGDKGHNIRFHEGLLTKPIAGVIS